jgi:hypothetical protein
LIRLTPLLAVLALLSLTGPAHATTIVLSSVSSDGTPASQLDAELDFTVVGATLTLTVTNPGSDYRISELYWNAADNVTGLSLVSATHSVEGDVANPWSPVGTNKKAGGFGRFDFSLTARGGRDQSSQIGPGEVVVFEFDISGTGPFAMDDFAVANAEGLLAAAKFQGGPPDAECAEAIIPTQKCPQGVLTEDSGYGGVPEPATGLLMALGLLSVSAAGRFSG